MKNYKDNGSARTPKIFIDYENGVFIMGGKCLPEEPKTFFGFLSEKLDLVTAKSLGVSIEIEYFNTSSMKLLLDLMERLKRRFGDEDLIITWVYDHGDEDMEDAGHDLADILGIDFQFIEKPENDEE